MLFDDRQTFNLVMASTTADGQIDHEAALDYWKTVAPDVDGMLGGFPQISRIDLQGSANFLGKLRRLSPSSSNVLRRGADCGAGIGRVTQGFLSKVCETVDLVEPVEHFVRELEHGEPLADLRQAGRVGRVFAMGLEDWQPEHGRYDLIWNQWCLGHLTDAQLLAYLTRCRQAIKHEGWLIVKENISTHPDQLDIFDDVDNSVTRYGRRKSRLRDLTLGRTDAKFVQLFGQARLGLVRSEVQTGFPKHLGLYPVKQYALQPLGA